MCVTCTLIFHNLLNSDNIPNIIWKCQQHRPLGFSVIIPDAAFSSRDMCNGTILFWFYEHSLDIHNRHTPIFGSSFFFFFMHSYGKVVVVERLKEKGSVH